MRGRGGRDRERDERKEGWKVRGRKEIKREIEGDRQKKKKHKQIKNIQIQMHKKCIRREEGRNDMRNQVNGMLEVGRKERMERKGESRRHREQQQQQKNLHK